MAGGRGNASRNNKNKKKQRRSNNKNGSLRSNQSANRENTVQPPYWPDYLNFVHEAGIGCHIGFPRHYYLQDDRLHDEVKTQNDWGVHFDLNFDWTLGWDDIDDDDDDAEYDDDNVELPELQIDPNDYTLSLYNYNKDEYQIAFISIYDYKVYGRNSKSYAEPLSSSFAITKTAATTEVATLETIVGGNDEKNKSLICNERQELTQKRTCTTLIVLCPPCTVGHLCYLEHKSDDISYYEECIDSDIQIWKPHPNIHDVHTRTIRFPLLTTTSMEAMNDTPPSTSVVSSVSPSYLCTQGVGGSLTHFLIGNYHAIDFACPIGTPIIAVGNGTVEQVHLMSCSASNDNATVTGIAVSNLFHWNSIMLRLDDDAIDEIDRTTTDTSSATTTTESNTLYVEYVHISESIVQVGDIVREGQIIGSTGSVGFSPEPHLHIAVYRSSNNFAPTCGVYFHCTDRRRKNEHDEPTKFLPVAGQQYNENGIVQNGDSTTNEA